MTDNTGQPLSGATILIKGTTNSVKSDARGHFTIEADADVTLIISYIGFKTQEIKIQRHTHISVHLGSSAAIGYQVVVIG